MGFASSWYQLLGIHAPLESYRHLLTSDVEPVFPEATVFGFEGYTGWYNTVVGIFLDEVHTLKVADIVSQSAHECSVHVVGNWKASAWKGPAARSTRLMMDAYQTWKIVRSEGSLKVAQYVVNGMTYEEGSCKL